jgi:hypothetical protein
MNRNPTPQWAVSPIACHAWQWLPAAATLTTTAVTQVPIVAAAPQAPTMSNHARASLTTRKASAPVALANPDPAPRDARFAATTIAAPMAASSEVCGAMS